ncbi:MAG: sugar ABC transporter permease [Lachnospiraceae bacterium]|jgi:arabinogalactan oligomer/maltooligosaccharide transport system permease protein|nr:sugar ABC transporter permease [Lachnospiraceae bacterium]
MSTVGILASDGSNRQKVVLTATLFMGLAHIIYFRQYLKGAIYALLEVIFIIFIPTIVRRISSLIILGEPQPDLPIMQRDNSMFMLIDGVITIIIIAIFFVIYYLSVKDATHEYHDYCINHGEYKSNRSSFANLLGKAFPVVGLAPSIGLVVFFVLVPLLFSAAVAFTNYASPGHIPPGNTVDWVGSENFTSLFGGSSEWTSAFIRVAIWTLTWATAATVTCYFGGLLMAVVLHESKILIKPFFRTIFILPYAVPAVVSMLVWQNLLNGTFGIINRTLIEIGVMSTPIPWLSDASLVKFVVVAINLWAGFPYFMLLSMGTMTAISADVYEAAKIDGASKFQVFRRISLPLVLYQTMPLIIMSFTHNVNNFGAIFFLTGGGPTAADSTTSGAGATDILVTWIYKLTINLQQYKYAAVIAVLIFVVLAPFAIWNFSRTKSYREGEL